MAVFLKAILAICLLVEIISTTPLKQLGKFRREVQKTDKCRFQRKLTILQKRLVTECENLEVHKNIYFFMFCSQFIACLTIAKKARRKDLLLNQLNGSQMLLLSLSECALSLRIRREHFLTQQKWFNRMYCFT